VTTGTRARHETPRSTRHDPQVRPVRAIACTFAAACILTAVLLGHVVAFNQGLTPPSHPWPLIGLSAVAIGLLLEAFRKRIPTWQGVTLFIALSVTATALWFSSLLTLL